MSRIQKVLMPFALAAESDDSHSLGSHKSRFTQPGALPAQNRSE